MGFVDPNQLSGNERSKWLLFLLTVSLNTQLETNFWGHFDQDRQCGAQGQGGGQGGDRAGDDNLDSDQLQPSQVFLDQSLSERLHPGGQGASAFFSYLWWIDILGLAQAATYQTKGEVHNSKIFLLLSLRFWIFSVKSCWGERSIRSVAAPIPWCRQNLTPFED